MHRALRFGPWLAAVVATLFAGWWFCGRPSPRPPAPAPAATPRPPGGSPPASLALILGIDDYVQPDEEDRQLGQLRGAVNDAARARELLVDRFGFAATDIVTLLGPAATHEAILRTFHEHLIQRAGPATKVVIWFSGHGSRVPDAAKADTSPRDDFDEPWDDTLLAYDSRAGRRHGSHDVTDDELHSLLAALPAQDILLVTDCCHSGGLLRGGSASGSRRGDAGTQPLDFAAIKPFWPAGVPFLDDDRGSVSRVERSTVHIAACSSMQEAGECEGIGVGGNQWYGTLTWYLTGVLAEVDSRTSWQAVVEIVRARIAAERGGTRADQLVQCNGDGSRAILGGRGKPVPSGYLARRRGSSLQVEAGRIHGIVEDSELRVVGHDDKEHGLVRVYRTRATFCEAEPIGGWQLPAALALRAIPHQGLEGRAPLRIHCEPGVDAELLQGFPWAVAATRDTADYVLVPRGADFVLQTPEGAFVRHVAPAPAEVREALFREHSFRSLWEGVAQPGRHRVSLAVQPFEAAEAAAKKVPVATVRHAAGGERALVGAPYLPDQVGTGAQVKLIVTNESTETLHVAVLSVAEDRAINVIWGKGSDNVLGPGASHDLDVELGPNPAWKQARPMIDRYIAIATPSYADFKPFAAAAPAEPTRGGGDRAATADSMPAFLAGALTGATTRGGGGNSATPPAWGIRWLDLELVLPDQFEAMTKPR